MTFRILIEIEYILFCRIYKKRFLIKAVDFLETKNHDETEKKIVRGDISPHFQATVTFSAMLKTTCENSLVRDRTEKKNVTAGICDNLLSNHDLGISSPD